MASYEQIFFDPLGAPLVRAVGVLALRLEARSAASASGWTLTRRITDLETGAFVTGEVAGYEYAESEPTGPEDRDIFDGYPYYWSAIAGPRRDSDLSAQAMRDAFDRLATAELGWPLVLTHDYDLLVATYDVDAGVRLFPRGTRSSAIDEHIWG